MSDLLKKNQYSNIFFCWMHNIIDGLAHDYGNRSLTLNQGYVKISSVIVISNCQNHYHVCFPIFQALRSCVAIAVLRSSTHRYNVELCHLSVRMSASDGTRVVIQVGTVELAEGQSMYSWTQSFFFKVHCSSVMMQWTFSMILTRDSP